MDVRSSRPLRASLALALAGGLLAMTLVTARPAAAAPPTECREQTCVATLAVGRKAVNWRSPQTFYPENEQVYADVSSRGTSLTLIRSYGAELCKHRFFGSGMTVVVRACGSQTALRVRGVRLKRGRRTLQVSYKAAAVLDGGPSPEPGTATTTDPLTALLQPITGLLGL